MTSVQDLYNENVKNKRVCMNYVVGQVPLSPGDEALARKIRWHEPRQILHLETPLDKSLTVRTTAESVVWTTLIQPLFFPGLCFPKRLFLLHGADGSGKSALVGVMYKGVENVQPDCLSSIHFRFNCRSWVGKENKQTSHARDHWAVSVKFLQNFVKINPNCYVIVEFEFFHLLAAAFKEEEDFLKDFLHIGSKVFLVGTTDNNNVKRCAAFFDKHRFDRIIIEVKEPDEMMVQDFLMFHLFDMFNVLTVSDENKLSRLQLENFIKDQAKILVEKHVQLTDLRHIMLPRIRANVSRARLHWVNPLKKCVIVPPSGDCSNDTVINKNASVSSILEKPGTLDAKDMQTLNPEQKCEAITKQCEAETSVTLDAFFLNAGWELIKRIMLEAFINVEPRQEPEQTPEEPRSSTTE